MFVDLVDRHEEAPGFRRHHTGVGDWVGDEVGTPICMAASNSSFLGKFGKSFPSTFMLSVSSPVSLSSGLPMARSTTADSCSVARTTVVDQGQAPVPVIRR